MHSLDTGLAQGIEMFTFSSVSKNKTMHNIMHNQQKCINIFSLK